MTSQSKGAHTRALEWARRQVGTTAIGQPHEELVTIEAALRAPQMPDWAWNEFELHADRLAGLYPTSKWPDIAAEIRAAQSPERHEP